MPTPSPVKKTDHSAYSTPVDVSSSSDLSSDEYWAMPEQKRKNAQNNSISSVPRSKKEYRGNFKPAVPNSTTSPSGSAGSSLSQFSRGETLQPSQCPVAEASTPQKVSKTPAGTPNSRNLAVEAAFKKLDIAPASQLSTPSRSHKTEQKQRVIVIDSDSEKDLLPTDEEPTSSPTRPSFRGRPVLTTASSQSPMNSPFSPVSATSSFSSVAPSIGGTSTITPHPIRVADIFTTGSPNVTPRRAPMGQPSQASQNVMPPVPIPTSPQEILDAVVEFARSSFCADLDQHFIAHDDQTQKLMDDKMISWGTQYELARGVSNKTWSWSDVQAHVLELQGRNVDSAFKVQQVMKGRSPSNESFDMTLWKEFDREQAAIMENKGRGLGLMGEWDGVKDWYGGQIQQLARLGKDSWGGFKVVLEPLEKRRSHRYGRFYGSRRFIQLRVPDDFLQKDGDRARKFLVKKFVLCGRIFYPFHAKEGSIYLVETNEDCGNASREWSGDQFRMSFHHFINWHNPLEEPQNHRQTKSKYATRFALGLSNSVPALQFKEENISFIEDITAEDWPKDRKNPPAEKLMTDGCGLINHAALHAIVKQMGYDSLPAGVQGRIAGGKGFWILHPTDESSEPTIWIRNSQNKIHYQTYHRAHCILDLLAPSRPSPPIALTQQSIMNLFHNRISAETLVRLMEEGLEEEVAPLLDWDKPHGMIFLWDAINKAGNVSGTRTQRVSVALNRALGFKGRDWGHGEADDAEIDSSQSEDKPSTAYTGRNMYSGAPLALHEVALELVQSGFHPAHSKLLNSKIGYIVLNLIKTSVEKYRIPILESLGAFIVPDPLNILQEGEVSYRFSKPRKDPRTEMLVHALEGEVIVGRYPMRLPSDMQKVTAVDRRELDKWPDVLIISVKGFQSLASLLAGGDMDGDEIIAIWDPDIVEPFRNKPLTKEPSDLIKENFQPHAKVETLENFCLGARNRSLRETSEGFMATLIGNLSDSQVGLYSMMHEKAVITHGYDHPESIRLAYMQVLQLLLSAQTLISLLSFSTLLDASKTGHRLKHGLKDRDLRKYPKHKPNEVSSPSQRDILGILSEAARRKGDELYREYQSRVVDENQLKRGDKDLLAPYSQAWDYAYGVKEQLQITAFLDDLSRIRKHVIVAHELFESACASNSAKPQDSPVKKGRKIRDSKQEDPMVACARAYAQPIEDVVLIPNLEQVKASFACHLVDSPSFAFTVAFQELCHIKVMACSANGGHAPTLRIFDEAKSFSASYLKALKTCDEQR